MTDRGYLIWKGHGTDQGIYRARRDPGHGIGDAAQVGYFGSSRGIGAVVKPDDHGILAAWRGADDDSLIWTATANFDGGSWSDPQAFAGGSTHGPALAASGSVLVMAWKGSGGDDLLWRATYQDRWSEQHPAVGRSSHGPALGRIDSGVVLVWKGAGGDEQLWWSRDGFRTQQAVRAGYTTSDTPAFVGIAFGEL
jgi:hypothetical protein